MKDQSFSYRIVKVGGKAVAVALTAFGLMAGAAQAADVWLGTSYSYVTPSEVTTNNSRVIASFYGNGDKWLINNGVSVTELGMNNPIGVATVNSSYAVSTSRSGDIFYGNTVNYVVDGNVLDAGYSVSRFGGNWSCNDNNSNACTTYWASAQRSGTYLANNFAQIIDNSSNNYHFGSGAVVNAQTRGERAYAVVSNTWRNDNDAYVTFSFDGGAAAQTDINNVAVNVNGIAYFDGNNTINGDVSTYGNYIRGSNVVFNSSDIAGGITYQNAGTVYLNGTSQNGLELVGNVDFNRHDGVLNLANNTIIRGSVTANDIANATVNFLGRGEIEGEVGPLKAINVQANRSLVQLNTVSGDTTVGSINYSADQATVEVNGKLTGNVNMNGHYSKLELLDRNGTAAGGANGMNGVLDFGMYKSTQALVSPDTYGKGTLEVGNNVNVKFSDDPTAGIKLTNADNATVVFAGNSTVTGNLGSADSTKHNTPYKIYAGAGTSTVTFNGHVFVGEGDLNVGPSNTTVKLNGATGDAVALTGNLVFGTGTPVSVEGQAYSTYGDAGVNGTWGNAGTVELADGKDITGSITTTTVTNDTGNMKFMGSSAYANNIGTQALKLNSVVFNAAATSATSTIAGNVWASEVTIGNGTNTTTATLTAGEHQLGDKLTLAGANTTLNLLGATTTKNTDGTLSNADASTVKVGDNGIVTNGATLNFAVNAGNVAAHTGAIIAPTQGSIIKTTGSLTMNGNEKVNVTLLGSMRNGQTIKLIDAVSTNSNALNAATLVYNSFVIDTATSRDGGDLVMTATRANNQYIAKSETTGHFSNAAALRLGTLAANGSANGSTYTSDMQTVFNKLDLNEWGFGNNQANLAKQVKRLAPISNGSIAQSALDAGNLALNTMGNRMASLRADKAPVGIAGAEVEGRDGQWIKLVGNNSKQNAKGDYDGYSANTSGLVWGADTRIDKDALLGVGLSATNTRVSQSGFRSGDSNSITSYEIAGYGAYQFTEEFYGEGSLSYARHNITGNRLTALDRVAKADYSANQLTGRLGIGYRFVLDDKQTLTPMLNLESSSLSSGAYTETGADALNLKLNSQKLTRTRTSLGLRYLAENTTDAGTVYRPELTAAIYRDGSGTTKETVAAFEGDLTGNTFSTTNAVLGRSGYNLAAGVSILNSKTSLVQLHLGYDHREGFSSTSARIKARWDF